MTRKLTPDSTLDIVRKDAKRWLKALRAGDAKARIRLSGAWPGAPEQPALRDVQHAIAREYGAADSTTLKAALQDLATDRLSRQERADTVLRHGWGGELSVARRIVARDPGLAKTSLPMACVCGDLEEVERRLGEDPASVDRVAGPLKWTPLLYVAYSRLPGPGADNAVAVARRLLDLGADPNFCFDDGWGNPFKALTGVIGQGEGVKPTHARADELVALLIQRGAEPFDTQALYNTSIVGDDAVWMDLLYRVSEQHGQTARWNDPHWKPSLGGRRGLGAIDYLLGNAVGQNHLNRARWLLEHGADAGGIHAYTGRNLHEQAQLDGFSEMAALLDSHGAAPVKLKGPAAFQAACMKPDEAAVREMLAQHPEYLRQPGPLLKAAAQGRADVTELLIALGVDVNGADPTGALPLHWAVHANALPVAQRLVAAGAEIDRREDKYNGTPISWGSTLGRPALVDFLAPLSRDVRALAHSNMTDRLQAVLAEDPTLANHRLAGDAAPTPLFCLPDDEAAAGAIAAILLRHGADRTVRNPAGLTAAEAAATRGLNEAAELIEAG